jgi:hypothetical protein
VYVEKACRTRGLLIPSVRFGDPYLTTRLPTMKQYLFLRSPPNQVVFRAAGRVPHTKPLTAFRAHGLQSSHRSSTALSPFSLSTPTTEDTGGLRNSFLGHPSFLGRSNADICHVIFLVSYIHSNPTRLRNLLNSAASKH